MMKHLRKLLSALLVLTMLLSALPMAAFAEEGKAPAVVTEAIDTHTHEQIEEPAESDEEDTLSGLTDEQLATLKDLPEGFSAEVVAYAMLRSTGCQHIDLDVIDNKEYDYKKINKEKHFVTIVYTARGLRCNDCGETLQTISYEKTVSGEYGHDWYWCGWDESESSRRKSNYSFRCDNCDERITLDPPCNHESLVDTASEGLICAVCRLGFWPGYDNDAPAPKCEHANYAVIYPGEEETVYLEWDYETHLKKKSVTFYFDDDNSWGYDAKCNDCGKWLIYENGIIDDTDCTGRSGVQYRTTSSEFEAHSFVNGVCELCGEEKVEETCQHTNTKRVENTSKRMTERKPFDDAQHEVIVTKYYELYCADCNAYIRDDGTEESTSKEAHDFGNGDTCECGYKKTEETCQHTNTKRIENTSKRSEERKPFDDAQHEVIVTRYYELYCEDCNAYIRDDGTEESTSKEAHDFGNGDTCECGYKKTETSEDELYVRGFTMSATEITVGDKVSFTLDIANASNGDTMTIEMLADDKFTVTFENVTVRNGSANIQHEFSNEGMRSIKFRVVGGEYCKPQTLKVNPKPTGKSAIHSVVVEPKIDQARVERLGGETFTVTVVCNLDTVCVEMYFGKEHNQNTYRDSSDYVEANGNRIFKMTYTLGGDGKSYAGEYPISVRPFSYVDRADWKNNQMGEEVKITLKVTHDNVSTVNEGGYSYSWSANGHTRMQTITTTLECKVCGNVSKSSTKIAKGSEEPHDLKENGKCSVCGYSEKLVHPGKDDNWKTKAPIVVYLNAEEAMLRWNRTGKIRYVEQKWNSGNSERYRANYWTNVDQSEGKCTRAAASMALSYMGIDLLPKDMGDHCKAGYKEDASAKDSSCNTRGRSTNSAGEEYEMTYDEFLELYNDYASDEEGKYSPVVIHTVRWAWSKDDKKFVRGTHAFIVVGHDQSNPDYFYVVDPGHGNNAGTGRIKLTQEGQMRVADYQWYNGREWVSFKDKVRYKDDCKLIGVWQYYKKV